VAAILQASEVHFLVYVPVGRRLLAIVYLFKKAAINQSNFTIYRYTVTVKIYKHR